MKARTDGGFPVDLWALPGHVWASKQWAANADIVRRSEHIVIVRWPTEWKPVLSKALASPLDACTAATSRQDLETLRGAVAKLPGLTVP